VNLLINLILTKNISKELLSSAKLLPANLQKNNIKIENLFEDIFTNFKQSENTSLNNNLNDNKIQIPKSENDMVYNNDQNEKNYNNNQDLIEIFNNTAPANVGNNTNSLLNIEVEVKDNNSTNNKINKEHDLDPFAINNFLVDYNKKEEKNATQNNFNLNAIQNFDQSININPNLDDLIQKQKKVDLNDDNINLDFLNPSLNYNNKSSTLNTNNSIELAQISLNKILINQNNQNIKTDDNQYYNINSNPLDFFAVDSIKQDQNHKQIINKIDNNKIKSKSLQETNYSNNTHSQIQSQEGQNFSYLNFYLGNEENQNLLNKTNDSGNLKSKNMNDLEIKEDQSINNIGDINDIFALAEVLKQRNSENNNLDLSNDYMKKSETKNYRKSLDSNDLKNKKKKIEKLFYNDIVKSRYNMKIYQEKYDNEIVEIFLSVRF